MSPKEGVGNLWLAWKFIMACITIFIISWYLCVLWLQRILDVRQVYAESHGIIFNRNKTVCMMFNAKSTTSTATHLLKLGGQYVKSVDQYKYPEIVLDTELSDDKDIQKQLRYHYCAANKLRASFSWCSNGVKNVRFCCFCTPMYASQLWCNFRKSCTQRLCVAYNFGCRALYNMPWRANVSSYQVQCNMLPFEALLQKYTYLFLERCRKSNNKWLRALTQSDCLYSSLFFEHYNHILLCEWMVELCSIRLIDGASSHNAFAFHLDLTNLGIGALLCSTVVTSVTC